MTKSGTNVEGSQRPKAQPLQKFGAIRRRTRQNRASTRYVGDLPASARELSVRSSKVAFWQAIVPTLSRQCGVMSRPCCACCSLPQRRLSASIRTPGSSPLFI